jgi:ParB family chromosome partitioning protein
MSKQRDELGKGLKALLSGIEKKYEPKVDAVKPKPEKPKKEKAGSIEDIQVSKIVANASQPRTEFDKESLEELATSIKTFGIIQPLTVRQLDKDTYEIISGERRFRASQIAGLKKLPCYVRKANDQELLEMALVENIQRTDLNAIEISISYNRLINECGLTHKDLSKRLGKQRSTITNYLRLLKLPPSIQTALKNRSISMGHARAIAGLEMADHQLEVFQQIISKSLSVRQTETLVRNIALKGAKKKVEPAVKASSKEIINIQDKLAEKFETRVKIDRNAKGKGKLNLFFTDDKQLNEILEKLGYFD